MTASRSDPDLMVRLQFLADVVQAQARLLALTHGRLFAEPMTSERAVAMRGDADLSERADAFVDRFGRLQDTLGDKLLPALLTALAERPGAAIDNLNRAERLGFVDSVDDWIEIRRLRNRMVHEYVRDADELARALNRGAQAVPMLCDTAARMAAKVATLTTP